MDGESEGALLRLGTFDGISEGVSEGVSIFDGKITFWS